MTLTVDSEETKRVKELRLRLTERLTPEQREDDHFFRRFLRARDQNIDEAEEMLNKHLIWRKTFNVDTMLTEYKAPELYEKYCTLDLMGFNSDGTPIILADIGNLDLRGFTKSSPMRETLLYVIYNLERFQLLMKEQTKKTGKLVDKMIVVVNLENLLLSTVTHRPSLERIMSILEMYSNNYPEFLKTGYGINASAYFYMAWVLVSPFLDKKTIQKVQLYGKANWHDVLKNNIDGDALPAFLGGRLTDPDGDPMCKTIVRFPQKIPQRYYFTSSSVRNIPNAKKIVVHRMSKTELKMEVRQPGSNIEWEFLVKNHDIVFSVSYKEADADEPTDVVQKHRISTQTSSEAGVYHCDKAGIYIIEFDNRYSWLHAKEIFYKVWIQIPKKAA